MIDKKTCLGILFYKNYLKYYIQSARIKTVFKEKILLLFKNKSSKDLPNNSIKSKL